MSETSEEGAWIDVGSIERFDLGRAGIVEPSDLAQIQAPIVGIKSCGPVMITGIWKSVDDTEREYVLRDFPYGHVPRRAKKALGKMRDGKHLRPGDIAAINRAKLKVVRIW